MLLNNYFFKVSNPSFCFPKLYSLQLLIQCQTGKHISKQSFKLNKTGNSFYKDETYAVALRCGLPELKNKDF